MGVRRDIDLIAWQLAESFKRQVYELVLASGRAGGDLRYRGQLLEAARSVPANLSEGFLRCSAGEFSRFCGYALGSLAEAERRLHDGIHLGHLDAAECQHAFRLARRSAMAILRLKQSQDRYRRRRR
jgi:four helix bundle protein